MSMAGIKPIFSYLRTLFWPVYGHEMRKFLPLFVLAFFIGFNYNILRNVKDALLVTAESSGAEVIPFIKVWGMVPGAILMTYIYSRLSNRLRRDKVFYTMISLFLAFFAFFAFVLFPIREQLHLHAAANFLQAHLPVGFKGLIAMLRYWSFSSFYIMSELWSSTILSMLFWGFANEITKLGEAKRFYALIAIGLNLAAISSGQTGVLFGSSFLHSLFPLSTNPWEQTLYSLTTIVLASGVAILILYRYIVRKVLTPSEYIEAKQPDQKEGDAPIKMSLRENFSYLAKSKYLINVAIIVLAYNLLINLIEVIWKDQVSQLYPNPNDFNAYMSQITTVTGIISLFTSLFLSGLFIRKWGWTFTALITPMILLATSIGFFTFFFGKEHLMGIVTLLGTSPLALIVFFGSAQNCLCRGAKYTLFDATKEMAFIPLNYESKLKGKAAIDGIGSRLGKSCGSLIHQGLLMVFSTISASAPYVASFLLVIFSCWLVAVRSLGKQFNALTTGSPSTPSLPEVKERVAETTAVVS